MKPVNFRESNTMIAKDQDEYLTLPAHITNDVSGTVIFCIKANFWERLQILFTGRIWCSLMTFKSSIQPSYFTAFKSSMFGRSKPNKS